jgi:hypothetical protein
VEESENVIFTKSVPCTEEALLSTNVINSTHISAANVSIANPTNSSRVDFCKVFQVPLEMAITTDVFPEDTSWIVINDLSGETIASHESFDLPIFSYRYNNNNVCLYANNIYTFTLLDSHGDSIGCHHSIGNMTLILDGVRIFNVNDNSAFRTNYTFTVPLTYCEEGNSSIFEIVVMSDSNATNGSWALKSDQHNVTDMYKLIDKQHYHEYFCIPQHQTYNFIMSEFESTRNVSVLIDGREIFNITEDVGSQIQYTFRVDNFASETLLP